MNRREMFPALLIGTVSAVAAPSGTVSAPKRKHCCRLKVVKYSSGRSKNKIAATVYNIDTGKEIEHIKIKYASKFESCRAGQTLRFETFRVNKDGIYYLAGFKDLARDIHYGLVVEVIE